jgi:pyruvate formate lyase activating enzyme
LGQKDFEMKEREALFWKRLKGKTIQCELCPHFCVIEPNSRGKCHTRENVDGVLIAKSYSRPCSMAVDPIEKKPLYHFLPGQKVFSIATAGCNLKCLHCQNFQISQAMPEDFAQKKISPEKIVDECIKRECKILAFTYTEPTVYYEYMLKIAKICKKKNIKTVIVSNGFINPKPLKKLCNYISAANIDLKSIKDEFYKEICSAKLQPVLDSLKLLKKCKIFVEVTNLIIPTKNDSEEEILELIKWVKNNIGEETPLHFIAFYPTYMLMNLPRTSEETLLKARDLAIKEGMKHVYAGNILNKETNTTKCQKCKKVVVERDGFVVSKNKVEKGKCKYCKTPIIGIF